MSEEKVVSMEDALKKKEELKEKQDEQVEDEKVDLDGFPTRGEIIEIMSQFADNMNQMADYLMQDVNTMYSQHVFPFQLRLAAIEDILVEKGITSIEEIDVKVKERYEKLEEQAKEIKDKENSGNSLTSEDK